MKEQTGNLPARWCLAIASLYLAVLTFFYRDFALQWQPISHDVPMRFNLLVFSGAALLTCGVGLLFARTAPVFARLFAPYLFFFWVLPHLFQMPRDLSSVASWLGLAESAGCMLGALALSAQLRADQRALGWTRAGFGACCIVYGISHFVYADYTAAMVPAWLPARHALALITGGVHVLAGIALMLRRAAALGALAEALMMSAFVLLLHVPSVLQSPPPAWAGNTRVALTALGAAMLLTAAAWNLVQGRSVAGMAGAGAAGVQSA